MKLLENKNAIITGGSEGIGLGIADSFAQNGANLILIGREIDKLKKAKAKISKYGTLVHVLVADLSDMSGILPLSKQILDLFSQVDVLVNNAGVSKFAPYQETDELLLDKHLNINVKAPFLLTQALLSSLAQTKGNIINISSYFAHRMLQGRTTTAYSLTKGAINSFTKSLAFEVGNLGIRVNAIAPGTIQTPMFTKNLLSLSNEKQTAFHEMITKIYPLGRIGTPKDIGNIAAFLASNQASWITGTVLAVDGGLTTN